MSSRIPRWTVSKWLLITLVFGLLQLWLVLLLRWLHHEALELWSLLADGVLIFYANGIAMTVLFDKLNMLAIVAKEREGKWVPDREFVVGIAVPLLVLLLSVTTYLALLTATSFTNRIVWAEIVVTFMALLSSIGNELLIAQRLLLPPRTEVTR